VLIFVNKKEGYYFNITDVSLIKARLDDALMESNEDGESDNQFLLKQVFSIRKALVKLVSISLVM